MTSEGRTLSLDDLASPKPRGSAQCPDCGRFCKIVGGSTPLAVPEDAYALIECPTHGRRVS